MGTLRYGSPEHVCIIDDRALMHVQIVIINKLRRGEHFAFSCDDIDGPASLWMSPHIPIQFDFLEPGLATVNPAWITALDRAAGSVHGLRVVDEPDTRRPNGQHRAVS